MDAQHIPVSLLCERNSVVQILGVLPVYGHHLPVSYILSARHVRLADVIRHTARLVQHLLRKLAGQVTPLHDGHDIHSRVIHMPQYLHNPALRLSSGAAIGGQLHHYLVAVYGSPVFSLRDEHVLQKTPVVRNDKSVALLFRLLIEPHQGGRPPLQDPDHAPLLPVSVAVTSAAVPPVAAVPGEGHLHRVSVKRAAGVVLIDKNILLPAFHSHKSKSPRIGLVHAGEGLGLAFTVFSFLADVNLSLVHKAVQHFLQLASLLL